MKFSTHLQSYKQFHLTKFYFTSVCQPYCWDFKSQEEQDTSAPHLKSTSYFSLSPKKWNESTWQWKNINPFMKSLLCSLSYYHYFCLSLVNNYSRGFTDDWPTPQLTFMDTYKRIIPDFRLIYNLVSFLLFPYLQCSVNLLFCRLNQSENFTCTLTILLQKKNLAFLFHHLLDDSRRNSSFYWF